MFFGQNFVFYKLLVDFCTLWTSGNHSKLNLKRWVIWNVILKDAGCSNGLIVNTQLTLHLCKLVLEFQELSDSDNWQCYLIISLHSYLQICKGTKIVKSILFAFECWPAFSYKSYQIRFVFLAKLNSLLILESSDYPCKHKTNILKHIKAWFLFISSTPMSDQDRISPYNINTISNRQVMRIKKNIS